MIVFTRAQNGEAGRISDVCNGRTIRKEEARSRFDLEEGAEQRAIGFGTCMISTPKVLSFKLDDHCSVAWLRPIM